MPMVSALSAALRADQVRLDVADEPRPPRHALAGDLVHHLAQQVADLGRVDRARRGAA